jgi:hypothetical protein
MSIPRWLCNTLLVLGLGLVPGFTLAQEDWQLAKEEADIKVYTRKVPGQALKSFRAETTITASPEALLQTITDLPTSPEWMDRCAESRKLESYGEEGYLAYTLVEVPWPLQPRDLVSRVNIRHESDRIVLEMENAPDAYPEQLDVVRMPKYEGRWTLISQGDGRTRVINQGATSPGGQVPDWLANSAVVDSPYKTMANLRARMEQ